MRTFLKPERRPEGRKRGSALIEFVLVGSFIFVPLLAGLVTVGMSMSTAMQVANLNATAAQMFSTGTDFTQPAGQTMLQAAAGSLNTSASGGGIVILSEIDGTDAGPTCSTQAPIQFGGGSAPTGKASQCAGLIASMASPPPTGESVYLAETYYNNPQLKWVFAPAGTGAGIYVKAIF